MDILFYVCAGYYVFFIEENHIEKQINIIKALVQNGLFYTV